MKKGLASWFAIWHPRYRAILVQLILAGALASGLVYVQNDLLGLLTGSLAAPAQPAADRPGASAVLSDIATSLHVSLPLLILGFFILARAVAAALEFWREYASGKLTIRTKDDMETEILANLLRKDDAFFSRHSPAETVNRLAVDLFRISSRRGDLMQIGWSLLLIGGNFVFFCSKDWRLAVVALGGCLAGTLWTHRLTRHVRRMDGDYLTHDDRVKSQFEDLLRAAGEVQVGRLGEKVRHRFTEGLAGRTTTFLRYVRLNATLVVGSIVSYLLTFVAMIIVVLYQRSTGRASEALALLPVVIWALPSLFGNASQLIYTNVKFQLARTSMDRLLEYEAAGREHGASDRPPAEPPGLHPFVVENVTCRYAGPDGALQGGVADVSTTFEPRKWTAVVGGAGSGKSTILKLLLGRLTPQAGTIRYGQAPLNSLMDDSVAPWLSVMPQSPALLNASIGENLLFGRPPGEMTLSEADLAVIERVGLGRICRVKALDMMPRASEGLPDVADVRRGARRFIEDRCQVTVLPYEDGQFDPKHWVLEWLLAGKCDRRRSAEILLRKASAGTLRSLLATALGAELAAAGREVLHATRRLLGLGSYSAYARLAPFPIDESIWRVRSASAGLADKPVALCVIALTSAPAELGEDGRRRDWSGLAAHQDAVPPVGRVRGLLGETCRSFDIHELHPHMTWRENVLFGVMDAPSSRAGRTVDQTLLGFLEQEGLGDTFTGIGLDFEIGRLGGNLSGGQGQLVGLCRTLLRRTPVLILDEPTSALDPASRTKVVELLRTWKADRLIVTVSHDPDVVREADEIKLFDGGRLVACGGFDELQRTCSIFRDTLEQI